MITIFVLCTFFVLLLVFVLALLSGLLMTLFGVSIGGLMLVPALTVELTGSTAWTWVLLLSALLSVAVPVFVLVYWIVKWARENRHPSARFWLLSLCIWILSLAGLTASVVRVVAYNAGDIRSLVQWLDEIDEDDGMSFCGSRTTEPFHALDISGAVTADILVGQPQQVDVRFGPQGVIETEVKDGVLCIRGIRNHGGKVRVAMPELQAITLTGACKAELEGAADSLVAVITGASKLNAEDCPVRALHINVSGASKAGVLVTGTLHAQAVGASKIEYKGNPQVLQSLAVGASVIRQDN